jgi:hypothetical protein
MTNAAYMPVFAALALSTLVPFACKKEERRLDQIIASARASAPEPPPPSQPFDFPSASGLPPNQIIPTVNRAARESPPGQDNRIDEWLQGIHVPVDLLGPTRRFASDVGGLSCHYREKKLACAIAAKLSESAKFFVASSLQCLDATGHVLQKSDWKAPLEARRGERVGLPVDEAFLTACFDGGGVKLGVELLASPCAIPFPHQVRCAGEYATCRDTCKSSPTCDDRCETNRLRCLDVCKK